MISLILFILAGICCAVMDKINFHFYDSVFFNPNKLKAMDFWDPSRSWKNKWKNGDRLQGEKFPLSSTVLVFTTDAWHLFKFFHISLITLALVLYQPITNYLILDFVILKCAYTGIFELFFSKIFKHKE